MTKNIIVVDEQGNEYGATYPKRAKGLVKNGRARFIDENKICLACPPNEYLEDKEMPENKNVNTQETTATEQEYKVSESNSEISMEYIFTEIKAIREQTEYLNEALKMLEKVDSVGPGDVGAAAKANGIADVVKCRETTNQQILKFYDKVYDNLRRDERKEDEAFKQITLLQKQLAESSNLSLYRIGEALGEISGEEKLASDEQIANVCAAFVQREETLKNMLDFYKKQSMSIQNSSAKEKAELVKSSFDNVLAYIAEMELKPEDRYASIGDVTEHISQLLSQIMIEKN